jgi:23S rRNA pseudouridine2605 synthase
MAEGERLQKVLARGGVASRRDAETLITAGRVTVNGAVVTTLGTRVDPAVDLVEVDGKPVEAEERVYFLFHKPKGIVTTLDDPEGRPAIKDFVKDLGARVFPVGRLDFHTSGALLLTNDGALANALLHPKKSVAKTYVAKVRGVPTDEQVQMMRDGVVLNPVSDEPPSRERTRPAEVEVLRSVPSGEGSVREDGTTWLEITLREGRNRQIHRMAEAVGLFVMRLARISFAGMTT